MNLKLTNPILAHEVSTLDQLFRLRVTKTPDHPAYISFDKATQQWKDSSWQEIAEQVGRWQAALQGEGFQPGDCVALTLRNSIEWVIFEQAALGLGLVVVPLYTDDRPDNVAYILKNADVRLLLVQDARHWQRLAGAISGLGSLSRIILLDNGQSHEDSRVRQSSDWLPAEGRSPQGHNGKSTDLATIVYTSGTTGSPKGVMLSHRNILSNIHATRGEIAFYQDDRFLSFLPLSHMLERTAGYYLPMMAGVTVAYSRSVMQLADDMVNLQPTIMISVPRIFERIHTRLMQKLQGAPALQSWLFNKAVSTGWHHFEWRQGRSSWGPSLLLHPLLQQLVGKKVLARMGGRLRLVVSGGAALSTKIGKTFVGLGLNLVQGYGLTETSPIVSCNRPQHNLLESVGPALPGIEVRIGGHDELLVRGPNVMQGYWNQPDANSMVIDEEGWFHTGDQARINESGHIFITGRLKDILVLSNGEKVPPADMEMAISSDPLFEQVMVIGEGRPYLCALVILNNALWLELAQSMELDPQQAESLQTRELHQSLIRRIAKLCSHFPTYAKVRRLHLGLDPWTVENDLITATLKVKRNQVLAHYEKEIDTLYGQGPAS